MIGFDICDKGKILIKSHVGQPLVYGAKVLNSFVSRQENFIFMVIFKP